jgi:hypothetical protein
MEHINLLGAEDVRTASRQISSAAAEMKRAADQIECSLMNHRDFLNEWLTNFETAIRAIANKETP